MKDHTEKIRRLRQKYTQHPPEGMSPEEIRQMPDDALLDMDFFLNEDDEFDDDVGEEGFYIDFF